MLKELYTKWYSIKEFKEKDLIAKYQNSNSFKRYIDFREYEQTLNPKKSKSTQKKTEIESENTSTISEITDKELLQTIKPVSYTHLVSIPGLSCKAYFPVIGFSFGDIIPCLLYTSRCV